MSTARSFFLSLLLICFLLGHALGSRYREKFKEKMEERSERREERKEEGKGTVIGWRRKRSIQVSRPEISKEEATDFINGYDSDID
ncbi:hypothetical protein AWC38_SpisGene14543 [Stylophora pistillata]|uniref:Uncharacterized protein n=1 Tax=Stylophora pistillata TaxID=50429 RepID=A0A2B4RXC9_STYPI|nr:hypothetical protein AWC38_SpisGene14543 [Stylophora pistillata]